MCGKRLKYIKKGFTMFKMASELEKRLKYTGNGKNIWEMA